MRRLITLLTVVFAIAAAPAARACTPEIVDLGQPDGADVSEVIAFGPHGEAGGDVVVDQHQRAVLWRDGQIMDLGRGVVSDIDARGDVLVFDAEQAAAAIVEPSGRRRTLPGLRAGDQVYARRMNDRGDVGGASFSPGQGEVAATPVVWRAGLEPRALEIPLGFSGGYVKGLDNAGDAVGGVELPTGETLAAEWDRSGAVRVLPTAYPSSPYDEANVVDAHGDVLGATESFNAFEAEATLWRDGARFGLGHLDGARYGVALGINRHREAVGADAGADGTPHAWITRLGERLRPLPALSGGTEGASIAHAITDPVAGDVSAGGFSASVTGANHATVWRCAFALAREQAVAGTARAHRTKPPRLLGSALHPFTQSNP